MGLNKLKSIFWLANKKTPIETFKCLKFIELNRIILTSPL